MTISGILDSVTGWKWKLAAGVGSVALLALAGFLAYAQIQNYQLNSVNAKLDAQINDPTTGLLVSVAQCRTNAATAIGGLTAQNGILDAQAKSDAIKLADTTRRLAIAQAETKKAEAQAAVLLATPPRGATLLARVQDVDARLLESLK
ncbi:hypothetical protein U1872_06360 [Sphingomonas sp. RB3P16]|uniref:hypothetical protein n=1 Tax=Parasphingomonas frigoris TaxID=3096163 RepID=UPI002FC71DD9